jgi:hypothetical protein
MEKSKNYEACLTDIHTLLHMPIELVIHAGNNNTKPDTNTDTKEVVDFVGRLRWID